VTLPASSKEEQDEIETGRSNVNITPRMIDFQNEGGDGTEI
jgi:hypothetical protein